MLTHDNMIAMGLVSLARLSSHLGYVQSWFSTFMHPVSFSRITTITGHFKMGYKFRTRFDLSSFLALSFNSLKETMRIRHISVHKHNLIQIKVKD